MIMLLYNTNQFVNSDYMDTEIISTDSPHVTIEQLNEMQIQFLEYDLSSGTT